MNKEDLIIAVHGDASLEGGRYNILSSFTKGLLDGFNKQGVKSYTMKDCAERNLRPNILFGFNVTGYDAWQSIMDSGILNVMWTVDSIFAHNFEAMEKFSNNPNFILFTVTDCDTAPLREYFPHLRHAYVPHATDMELWKKQDVKKEYDIVLFSSIEDYEKKLEDLKNSTPESLFSLMMEMYNVMLENTTLPFWDIYQIFKKHKNLNLDVHQYLYLFRNLSYIIMYEKKAKAIQHLKDFNVKVFGDGPWEKYISGKVEQMGPCNLLESIDIMNKSKIALHPHAMQLSLSLHERPLNASSVETFVVSSKAGAIEAEFGDSMTFYNDANFEDIAEKMDYFLKNDEERILKAQKAKEIVKARHTWECRAESILKIL